MDTPRGVWVLRAHPVAGNSAPGLSLLAHAPQGGLCRWATEQGIPPASPFGALLRTLANAARVGASFPLPRPEVLPLPAGAGLGKVEGLPPGGRCPAPAAGRSGADRAGRCAGCVSLAAAAPRGRQARTWARRGAGAAGRAGAGLVGVEGLPPGAAVLLGQPGCAAPACPALMCPAIRCHIAPSFRLRGVIMRAVCCCR